MNNGIYIGGGLRIKTLEQLGGVSFSNPPKSFEWDCLHKKDLPILCDSCQNSDKKKFICKHYKIDKKKFNELQDIERCPKFKEII